jgi:Ribose/Galactose Isomerase
VDYPDFARAIAESILSGQSTEGILLCGSGVGACVWWQANFQEFARDFVVILILRIKVANMMIAM